MQFTNEFTIPLGVDRALDVLSDLERVAPCFPGATLESVDGDTYSGRVKVKVGPMSLTYSGDAVVTEVDRDAHTARIEAAGREKRGAGTATADVRAELHERDGATVVVVTTDLAVTGRPSQFGRGVMGEVGEKIIDRFAENLHAQLDEDHARAGHDESDDDAGTDDDASAEADAEGQDAVDLDATDAEDAEDADAADPDAEDADAAAGGGGEVPGDAQQASGPRRVAPVAPRDEALDLMEVVGPAAAKRLVPVVVAAVALLLLWMVLRRREDD